MRLIFMGTPEFAVPVLDAVVAAGHVVAAVYSRPPAVKGRGLGLSPSPVQLAAERLGLPVSTPVSLRSAEAQAAFAGLKADAAVVVAYGLILPQAVLDATRFGAYNLHGSRLPRWRGAAPIQRAIMAGDTVTAATVMRMEAGLDTGPVVLEDPIAITDATTAGALHDEMSRRGAAAMVAALELVATGRAVATPQAADGVTYAQKIDKAEARIRFDRPMLEVVRHINGLSPFPGAWFEVARGGVKERIKVLKAAPRPQEAGAAAGALLRDPLSVMAQGGAVELIEVQRAGKRPQSGDDFLRGFTVSAGDRVSD